MSTPDQPNGPGLTRKQMREIRMTGATPIIDPDAAAERDAPTPVVPPAPAEPAEQAAAEAPAPAMVAAAPAPVPAPVVPPVPVVPASVDVPAPPAHLPRAAEPIVAPPAPIPDAQVDLGVSPLTRRQAREQERIRTASVPVITPDVAAAHTAASGWAPAVPMAPAPPVSAPAPEAPVVEAEIVEESAPETPAAAASEDVPTITQLFGVSSTATEPSAPPAETESAPEAEAEPVVVEAVVEPADERPEPAPVAAAPAAEPALAPSPAPAPEEIEEPAAAAAVDAIADAEKPVLRPEFGAALFEGVAPAAPLAPSFDELIARGASSNGSSGTPNALILSQPAVAPLTAPVTATGEVLITGMLALPDGLGSQGHAVGTTDGREADAVLIDGELPPASSPTPIAASAAISTVKGTGEIIRPPAPEKGSKLMLSLAITAGVLAVALVGVLIVAFVTGVFS